MGTMQGIGVITLSMKIKLLFIQLLACLVLLFRTKIVQHKEQLMFNDLLYFGITHCFYWILNNQRSGIDSDGNFSSYLIRRSGYG